MNTAAPCHIPLVSVIIPCYNHGRYLQEAIKSVHIQGYTALEIIVIDDGSTDNTSEVAAEYEGIKYIYQENQGLSAARNTGITNSKGEFLIFLDADDWLLPGAIKTNLKYLIRNENLAFVSGGHDKVFEQESIVKEEITEVTANHYLHLLQGNYIGMHATVMYRRNVFDELKYDTTLKACEDYDLYLKIARNRQVYHHTGKIAAYRLHSTNMSANVPHMLKTVLHVLRGQQNLLRNNAEKQAYLNGKRIWKDYYCRELYKGVLTRKTRLSRQVLQTLIKNRPFLIFNYMFKSTSTKRLVKNYAPAFSLRWLHRMGLYKNYNPAVGKLNLGDLNQTKPISTDFGYERGGPIDRYYIEQFLRKEHVSIQGRVLEIGDNSYTMQFGGSRVKQSEILHVDNSNPQATYIGDISDAPHIPDHTFDCIVLTQTLHLIYDFKGALRTCYRILKPGGSLLLTVPGITQIDHGEWKDVWYWSFTDKSMRMLLAETFPKATVEINAHGNIYAATTFLQGMGLPEVSKVKLDKQDPHYQVIISVKAVKSSDLEV